MDDFSQGLNTKILKQGRGTYEGLIFKIQPQTSSGVKFIQGGGKKSSPEFFNQLYKPDIQFPTEITKNIQSSTSAVGVSKTTSNFGLGIISPNLQKTQQGASNGLVLDQKSFQNTQISQIVDNIENTEQKIIQTPKVTTIQRSRGRQRSKGNDAIIQTQPQIQTPKIVQTPFQTSKQTVKQINKLTFVPGLTTPFNPIVNKLPFPLIFPSIPGMDVGGLGKRRVKIKKVVRYTPSYSAIVFNIRGKAPKGTETGLRVRPIPKGTDNLLNLFSSPKSNTKIKRIKRIIRVPSFKVDNPFEIIRKRRKKKR